MKIAVCVKEVPDASAPKRLDPQTFRLDRSVDGALNEFDTHAIEEGLQLKTKSGEGEVVAVLMGPERAADSLRKALAIGADRAVHVSDEGLAGSDLVATSKALAKALEREGADLVLFGQQAGDSDGAVLWAAVADRLQLPVISQAASLEASRREGEGEAPDRVRVRRHRGADSRRRGRLRRDQRAPLPVPQGDHGREEEAAGDGLALRPRPRRGRRGRGRLAHRGARAFRSALTRRQRAHRGRRPAAAEKIVEYLSSHKLI